jgi:hypothetical protein
VQAAALGLSQNRAGGAPRWVAALGRWLLPPLLESTCPHTCLRALQPRARGAGGAPRNLALFTAVICADSTGTEAGDVGSAQSKHQCW